MKTYFNYQDLENIFAQAIFEEINGMSYGDEPYLFVSEINADFMQLKGKIKSDEEYEHFGHKFVDIMRNGERLYFRIDDDFGYITIEDVHNISKCSQEDVEYVLLGLNGDWSDSYTSCAIIQLAINGKTI